MKITKRSGSIVLYDDDKLITSIMKANEGTGEELSPRAAAYLSDVVLGRLVKEYDIITTKLIRESVISSLREQGYYLTAARYEEYAAKTPA